MYVSLGVIITIIGLVFLSWFLEDIVYLFQNPSSYTSVVRTIGTAMALFFGITYITYGLRPKKINKWSNSSIIALSITLLVSGILSLFECYSFGGICPAYTLIISSVLRDIVLPYGIGLSFLIAIISFFKK